MAGTRNKPSLITNLSIAATLLAAWISVIATAPTAIAAEPEPVPELAELRPHIEAALPRTLKLLQVSAAEYARQRACFSCHHQALPSMALALANQHGWQIDREGLTAQARFTVDYFEPRQEKLLQGSGVVGGPYTAGYALATLTAAEQPADATSAALVQYLLKVQEDDGRWRIRARRPPLEASHFTATALAVRGLNDYHKAASTEPDGEEADTQAAINKARQWLIQTEPVSNEDRIFQLLGLHWSGAQRDHINQRSQALLALQQENGGWEQEPGLGSDAYATGQALVALHESGCLSTDDPRYRRGVRFLLDTQLQDGSWLVESRSRPFQTYFESGFPHGKAQFISISASAWAAMALIHAGKQP